MAGSVNSDRGFQPSNPGKRDRVLRDWLKAQSIVTLECSTTCTKYKERLIQRSRTEAYVGTDPHTMSARGISVPDTKARGYYSLSDILILLGGEVISSHPYKQY